MERKQTENRLIRRVKVAPIYLVIIVVVVLWLSPYAWMVLISLRPPSQPFSTGIIPERITLTNLINLMTTTNAWKFLANSALMAFLAAFLSITLGSLAAYGFTRFRFRGRGQMMGSLLILRSLPPIVLSIAIFTMITGTPLMDTIWALVLVNAAINLPFCIWNLRAAFESINPELDDASLIDGCSRVGALFRIVLPLTAPGVVATAIFAFMLSWNEFLIATVLIQSGGKRMITTFMANNIGQFSINYIALITTAVVATLPLVILFLFVQRYLVAGLAMGGMKG